LSGGNAASNQENTVCLNKKAIGSKWPSADCSKKEEIRARAAHADGVHDTTQAKPWGIALANIGLTKSDRHGRKPALHNTAQHTAPRSC